MPNGNETFDKFAGSAPFRAITRLHRRRFIPFTSATPTHNETVALPRLPQLDTFIEKY
jgi:hypothetical protein